MIFEPVICTPSAWTSVCGRFGVHLFEGRVTVAVMDQMQSVGERFNLRQPAKRAEIVVVFPSDARMTHDERARMARLIKHGEAYRAASATVILAEGLRAAMQRSMLTGMMMIAPAPHPAKVFGTISEALKWLAPHAQEVCGPNLLLDELSSSLDAHMTQFLHRPDRPPQA